MMSKLVKEYRFRKQYDVVPIGAMAKMQDNKDTESYIISYEGEDIALVSPILLDNLHRREIVTQIVKSEKVKWRAKVDGVYWFLKMKRSEKIGTTLDTRADIDNTRYDVGNYFETKAMAEDGLEKANELFDGVRDDSRPGFMRPVTRHQASTELPF